ncbi:MAG: TerC family protein, partial [Planctomycetia bacterium]
KLEGAEEGKPEVTHVQGGLTYRFLITLAQIALLDIVFSLDSVITAVGMVQDVWVIVVAMLFTVLIMLAFAGPVGNFVERHPTLKVLALSFLILIGVVLVVEGMGQHLDKGYIYFAMGFSFVVEMLNLRVRKTT